MTGDLRASVPHLGAVAIEGRGLRIMAWTDPHSGRVVVHIDPNLGDGYTRVQVHDISANGMQVRVELTATRPQDRG